MKIINENFIIIVDTNKFIAESFKFSGENSRGTILLKNNIILPKQVEVKYCLNNKKIPKDDNYNVNKPTNLSNNDIIWIKFFIKDENINTYGFPKEFTNPIKIKVNRLKTLVKTNLLKDIFFKTTGKNGLGKIQLKNNIVLPEQIEAKYYLGNFLSNDNSYSINKPTNLSNNDIIWIKFFIKDENINTYGFPKEFTNPIIIIVNDLETK